MSSFSDLLNKPLPSAAGKRVAKRISYDEYTLESLYEEADKRLQEMGSDSSLFEAGENALIEKQKSLADEARKAQNKALADKGAAPATTKNVDEGCDDLADGTDECEEDADSMSVDDEVPINPADPTDAVIADDQSEDDEIVDKRIDDTMNRVATPVLLGGELSGDELEEFAESTESDAAVADGYLTEKTIVRFDKNARFAQLKKTAVIIIAKEKKDPLYKKLCTAWKIERGIERKLEAKYGTQANAKARQYLNNLKHHKSGVLKKVANKMTNHH